MTDLIPLLIAASIMPGALVLGSLQKPRGENDPAYFTAGVCCLLLICYSGWHVAKHIRHDATAEASTNAKETTP